MDLNEEYKKLYWNHNTKGKWNNTPIELLSDKHLMRIPKFINKKLIEKCKIINIEYKDMSLDVIPDFIQEEIKRRDMILNKDFTVKRKNINVKKKNDEFKLPDCIKRLNSLDKPIKDSWRK